MSVKRHSLILRLLLLPVLLLRPVEGSSLDLMPRSQVEELYWYAQSFRDTRDADSAAAVFRQTADRYDEGMSKAEARSCALSCMALSEILYDKEQYGEALDYGIKGIRICNSHRINDMLPYLYKTAGNVYAMYKDNRLALRNYDYAYRIAERQKDSSAMMACIINLSHISSQAGLLDEAAKYNQRLVPFLSRDSVIGYYILINKAMVLAHQGQYDSALVYHDHVIDNIHRQHLPPEFICNATTERAKLYVRMGNKDSALRYIESAMTMSEANGYDYLVAELLESLAQLNESGSDSLLATHYKARYLQFQDSLFNDRQISGIRSTQFLYEINKYADTIREQRRLLTFAIIVILIILIFCAIIWKQKKKLQETYLALFNRNQEITRLEHQNQNQNQSQKSSADNLSSDQITSLTAGIRSVMDSDAVCDSGFDIERLAELVHSNSKYVSKVINEQLGKNFRTLVNEKRIERAKNMLADIDRFGNYTIESISSGLGYKSQATFIAAFKKSTGLTPSLYQRMARENRKTG